METENPQKKIKVLTISDHPLSPSGVGTQTKYFIVEMLKTGKFSFASLSGAIKHDEYKPTKVEEFGDDWVIFPVDGYGNQDVIRSVIRNQKPDILWFMTDPRFFPWLWEIENEIRSLIPMVYYHVWDNYPYPTFNKIWYDSTDVVVSIVPPTSSMIGAHCLCASQIVSLIPYSIGNFASNKIFAVSSIASSRVTSLPSILAIGLSSIT